MSRRLFVLVASVILALLTGAAVASAGLATQNAGSPHAAVADDRAADDTSVPMAAGDSDGVPAPTPAMLPAAPMGLQRSPVPDRARTAVPVVALVAAALVGCTARRSRSSTVAWNPRFLLRVDGAPLRGPPSGAIPAVGI